MKKTLLLLWVLALIAVFVLLVFFFPIKADSTALQAQSAFSSYIEAGFAG